MIKYIKLSLALSAFSAALFCIRVDAAEFLNKLPATPSQPKNLAEAAGRYVGAVEQLNILKSSKCGYALKRQIPSYESVISTEILPAFPADIRSDVKKEFVNIKPFVTKQGQELFDRMYSYYTENEGHDKNTACGMITSSFITLRKMSAETFDSFTRN
jgi:hypothetical protein